MGRYIVTIEQRWKQKVVIENAASRREALVSARQGHYSIDSDPRYVDDINTLDWRVKEEDEDG